MDLQARQLIEQGDFLFSKRQSLMSLWQEEAENFYLERADFTVTRDVSDNFADNLTTSYPLVVRRDLGDQFSAMLRPTDADWFFTRPKNREPLESERAWLEYATKVQRRAMYDRVSQFVRAMKEGDQDFATFGQNVVSVNLNNNRDSLLYRCWHLRDVAWCENIEGRIDTVHRKWAPTARDLVGQFKGKVHQKVKDLLDKKPYSDVRCRHIVIPSEYYGESVKTSDGKKVRTPFVSIHIDVDNQHIMEEVGVWHNEYVIPRWQTVSGSQYAHSPATIIALPEARLIQAITLTLLEAGEKAVNPPMVAVQEAIRSDVNLWAGGITWADAEYDERLGEILRPITQDKSGLTFGMEMSDRIQALLAKIFYLDRLNLPTPTRDMTAYEASQRVQEYIRRALPLFEPMETESNGAICELTFDILMRNNAFGPVSEIPRSLLGSDIEFKFESPLHQASERMKSNQFVEAKAMLAEAAQLDPGAVNMIDARSALRDVLQGIGTPAKWMRDPKQMEQIDIAAAQQAEAAQLLEGMQQAAGVTKDLAAAGAQMERAA